MYRVCVFCGSKVGDDGQYRTSADQLGKLLVQRGYGLVYGGGSVGLMGVIADAVLEGGGEVIGVIPDPLATKELAHPRITQMHVVPSMHLRKARMAELADAFLALPGGYGTMEELFEVVSWAQLGIHRKPIGLLNVAGFFEPLVRFVDNAIAEGFIKPKYRQLLLLADDPGLLLDRLKQHRMPPVRKWISTEET